jgi:parallel beta helix pectate lyase-like protein
VDAKTLTGCVLLALLSGCATSPETRLRRALAVQQTGVIQLAPGVIEVSRELQLAPGAHDLTLLGNHTTLRATRNFQGRAILVAEQPENIEFRGLTIEGSRGARFETAPPENAFRVWYRNNGILLDRARGVRLLDLTFREISSFAILASRSSSLRIDGVHVTDSGSRNAKGFNNTTGGIVLEEGADGFEVWNSTFERIAGNALWTHSLRTSARAREGVIMANRFDTIGRDAIQVGHAVRVRVQANEISRVGYPEDIVDHASGDPVAIDTAGNVGQTLYLRNRIQNVNGKCFDLDGFHDGAVRDNTCTNGAHYALVMNNTDPTMQSSGIEISGNRFSGMKYGAVFLLGSAHRVEHNIFEDLNLARLDDVLLGSGIYLSNGASRPEETRGNVIRDNRMSGYRMQTRCLTLAVGIPSGANTVTDNTCTNTMDLPPPTKKPASLPAEESRPGLEVVKP